MLRRDIFYAFLALVECEVFILSNGSRSIVSSNQSDVTKSDGSIILENTRVILRPSITEFHIAFRSNDIKIPNKVREAVLKPMELTFGGIDSILGNSVFDSSISLNNSSG